MTTLRACDSLCLVSSVYNFISDRSSSCAAGTGLFAAGVAGALLSPVRSRRLVLISWVLFCGRAGFVGPSGGLVMPEQAKIDDRESRLDS